MSPVDEQQGTTKRPGGVTGKGFVKGDPRINRKGRPRTFDALRELAQAIAHEKARTKDGAAVVIEGHSVTIAEAILRQWAQSGKPQLQQAFIEVAFGKVPTPIEVRDWREAAKRSGLDPDEVVNEFAGIVASHMGNGSNDSGGDREGEGTEGGEHLGGMAQ